MKVTINSNDLKNALKDLALVKTNKLTMEVLQHYKAEIKRGYLFLSITDLDVEIVRMIDIASCNYSERLEFLIPRIALEKFSKAQESNRPISIEVDSLLNITLNCDGTLSRIPVKDTVSDFPIVEKGYEMIIDSLTLQADKLHEALNNISFSMGKKDVRFYLNGALFEFMNDELAIVSCDGHRLSIDKLSVCNSVNNQSIIPDHAIKQLVKLTKNTNELLTISITEKCLIIHSNALSITIKLIDGKFPDYRRVIPNNHSKKVTVNRQELLTGLKKIEPFTNSKYKGMRLTVIKNLIEVQAFNEDKMETTTTINCESNLEDFEIGFHLPYIKEALASSNVENVTIELENALSSGAIKEAINNSNRLMVVHPMRL